LSFPLIHRHFAAGYAAGKPLGRILPGLQMIKKFF